MKITESYWKENSDDRRANRNSRAAEAARQRHVDEANAATKVKQSESPINEDLKFAGILKSITDPPKLKQTEEDAGEQRRDDDKKDKKRAANQKDSTEKSVRADRVEQFNYAGGGQFGGGGSGAGGNIAQTQILSEKFAARSILHIADLERMISVIRKQTAFGGRREITLELKRSILEGLKVKITTGEAARTEIEFLAASEKIRSQIENHSPELSEILCGRGINLQSLTATLDFGDKKDSAFAESVVKRAFSTSGQTRGEIALIDSTGENTFAGEQENDSSKYLA